MSRKSKNKSPQSRAELDIVIVTGGRWDMLTRCLDALYLEAETTPISIQLIDQNTDPTERQQHEDLFTKRPDSKVVEFRSKRIANDVGYAAANNDGYRMGMSPFVMFLNDDVELQPGAIQEVLTTLKDPTIGICGIKLLFPPSSTSPIRPAGRVQHVGMALNIRGEPVHPLMAWSSDHPKCNISRDVLMVTGACLTISRKLFYRLGGFDTMYGAGTFEDCDLCMKAVQNGMRVYVNTKALGYHYTGSTAEKKQVAFPIQQNRMNFQAKWGPTGIMQWTDWVFL